jgi:hypothetical protein
MKSFKTFITEKTFADLKPTKGAWLEIPNDEFDDELSVELFDLIDKSYGYVGGHVNYRSPIDLPLGKDRDDPGSIIWYGLDFDDDPQADVIELYKKTRFGSKGILGATDGSREAKLQYIKYMVSKLNTPGNYAEVSDAIMHILLTKFDVETVDKQEDVEKVLGKKVEWVGEHPTGRYPNHNGFYNRSIVGEKHMKILVGKPNL